MITQPRLGAGADVGLPDVVFRFLLHAHMLAQQRMHRDGATTMHRGFLSTAAAQQQLTVSPGGQRCVHQPPIRAEHGEVHRGARTVQIRQKATQPVWQRLFAAHPGQRRQRHVETAGGLLDRVHEQRVGCQLREDPVAILQCGLHRRGEPHHVAQILHPVLGVAHWQVTRVVQGRRVEGNFRCHRVQLRERVGQLVEDRIDLGGM